MENCTICGKPLKKEGRTVHYICRCAEKFKKNGGNTCDTRRKTAFKGFLMNPDLFRNLFGI